MQKKEKVGIRQIKMIIEREYCVIMNKKKIARIKNKYGLVTKIRRKNNYRLFAKKVHEHKICPNLLNRNFKTDNLDEVYLVDITQLNYNNKRKKAYLAAFKDLCSKEIIAFNLSSRIDVNLTNKALNEALKEKSKSAETNLIIHSDQGFHFTHFSFRKKLSDNNIIQSMSRKGNCLDNAPMESFFGYLKDHLELDSCKKIEDVKKEVTKEIKYYNHDRPQLGLKKMPPVEYRRHLTSNPGFF